MEEDSNITVLPTMAITCDDGQGPHSRVIIYWTSTRDNKQERKTTTVLISS